MRSNRDSGSHDTIVANLFLVMSVRLQKMENVAIEGEAVSLDSEAKLDLAHRVHALAREIEILADAVGALIEGEYRRS